MSEVHEAEQGWVSLESLLESFVRHRWLLLGTLLSFLVLAVIYTIVTPKIYRATSVIMAVENGMPRGGLLSELGSLGSVAALAGINTNGGSRRQEGLATLRSKEFLFGFIREESLLPVLFSDDWDSESQRWLVDDDDDIPTVWDGYRELRERVINVLDDPVSGLIEVSVEWSDPEVAAEWANLLISRVNERIRQRSIRDGERNLQYLRAEIDKTTVVDLRQSLYGLVETEIQNIMLATVSEEYVFRVIDPAIAPDPDRYVHPRLLLMLLVGFGGGVVAGSLLVGLAELRHRFRS